MKSSWWLRAVWAVLVRPWLWWTALRQLFVLAPPRWWTERPWLPLPDATYLRFRMLTAYGDPDADPAPEDLVTYLRWCRDWPG